MGRPSEESQGFKPDPGNLAVRDYRGASGNVSHGGTVNPSCNRKSRNGNPSPTAGRARFLSQWGRSPTLGASQLVTGRPPILDGRRQPSGGGTSRMMREYHVRICERLEVKLPGSTRPGGQHQGGVGFLRLEGRHEITFAKAISASGRGRWRTVGGVADCTGASLSVAAGTYRRRRGGGRSD